MKSSCTHLSGTFPLLSARVSIESGGGEAQYSTVQKAHGCSCLMVFDYLKGEWEGLRWRRQGVYHSPQVMGLFRARRASRRPLSAVPSPAAAAAAAWGMMEASGGPGPNLGPRSPPALTRSGASRTAGLRSLRDSCSGRC